MITKIENIRNEFLFKQYKDMVDSMYEEIGSAKWGVRTRIKTKKIPLIEKNVNFLIQFSFINYFFAFFLFPFLLLKMK